MEFRSNTVDPVLVEELQFNGRTMDFVADEVRTASDGRIFVSGTITDSNTLVDKQFFIEVDDPDFVGFADKRWKEQGALFEQKMEGIIGQKVSDGSGAFTVSSGENFPDIEASIKEHAAPPAPVRTPEPEGPKPANLEAGEPIRISAVQGEPVLIEEFDLNGQRGDLVVHDIEFDNGKPFLTGTFSVETPTGSETKEFAVAIDSNRFPDVTELTEGQAKLLTSGEALQEMLGTAQHPIVLSTDEAFPNRGKILSDINGIQSVGRGNFNGDIPYLARLGQDYPELVDTMRLFEPGWAPLGREDGLIKIAIVEHLGIEDAALRVQLIDGTNGLGEFAEKLNQKTDLFAQGAETRAAISQMAELAETAADFKKSPKLGAGARALAGFVGVGTAMTAAAASASTYEGMTKTDLTHQQFADETITEVQRDALLEFHTNTTNAQYADAAFGAIDQFILPSLFLTLSVESEARDALTKISNETGLPESVYQTHARSMFGGHTASHTAVLEATDQLPKDPAGQPEVLHGVIQLNNSLQYAQVELTNLRTPYSGIAHVPDDVQDSIAAREGLVASLETRLVSEMEGLMRDPASFDAFMNMIPLDDRMEFVRALAAGDQNLAETNPVVAEATREFSGRGGTKMHATNVREAKAELNADNGAGLNEYIASRILLEAGSTQPEVAPDNSWDEELIATYYDPALLAGLNGSVVEEFKLAGAAVLAPDIAPEVRPEARPDVVGMGT